MSEQNLKLPKEFFDPYHHYYDPLNNDFQSSLKNWGLKAFMPEDYQREVIDNLQKIGMLHYTNTCTHSGKRM